jgi:hypothetical protein
MLPCLDCGQDTNDEWYMIHDELWKQAGGSLEEGSGFLCIGCLEGRLHRTLVPADFTKWPINDRRWNDGTVRLLSRLP